MICEWLKGGVDIPEAANYDAEQMYQKLLKQAPQQPKMPDEGNSKKQQDKMQGENKQEQNNNSQSQDSQQSNNTSKSQNSDEQGKQQSNPQSQNGNISNSSKNAGHDSHDLWEKAIEEKKKQER